MPSKWKKSKKGKPSHVQPAEDALPIVAYPNQPTIGILPGGSKALKKIDPFQDALEHVLSDETKRVYRSVYLSFARWLCQMAEVAAPTNPDHLLRKSLHLYSQVTPTIIRTYRNYLIAENRSSYTIGVHLSALSTLFTLMVNREVMDKNPADPTVVKRPPKKPKKHRKSLEPEQIIHLFNKIAEDKTLLGLRDLAIFILLTYTGLRRSEIARLSLDHLSQVRGIPVFTVTTKGGKQRVLEVIEPAWSVVQHWLECAKIESSWVFRRLQKHKGAYTTTVVPISPDGIYYLIRTRGRAAGFDNIYPHQLRHTHITLALRGDAKLHEVQIWVGHSDPKTTMGYFHEESFVGKSPARLIDLDWKPEK